MIQSSVDNSPLFGRTPRSLKTRDAMIRIGEPEQ